MPKKKEPLQLYVAAQKTKRVPYTEEGFEDDPTQVEVVLRRNLTNEELETLDFEPLPNFLKGEDGEPLEGEALAEGQRQLKAAINERIAEVDEALAPFVLGWNVGYLTPSGEVVQADPPAVAGGPQLRKFLPSRIVDQIYTDLRVRSTGLVKAARSTPLERGADTSGDSNSTPTGTAEA